MCGYSKSCERRQHKHAIIGSLSRGREGEAHHVDATRPCLATYVGCGARTLCARDVLTSTLERLSERSAYSDIQKARAERRV